MNELVSVVVTCHNHANYIEQCLRSIFDQTHHNIELLVFNDGSTDDSDAVIRRVLADSPYLNTRYTSGSNRGVCVVRNEALGEVQGEYLLFVDADNYLDEDHIGQLLSGLRNGVGDIAYCHLWDFERQIDLLRPDLEYSLQKMLTGNLIDVSALVRVSAVKDAIFDPTLNRRGLEDYDFWLSCIMQNGARPLFVSTTKLNYRVLANSRSGGRDAITYYQIYFYILGKRLAEIPVEIFSALRANVEYMGDKYDGIMEGLASRNQPIQGVGQQSDATSTRLIAAPQAMNDTSTSNTLKAAMLLSWVRASGL